MSPVTMYSSEGCGYCVSAERLLLRKGVRDVNKLRVDRNADLLKEMISRTGRRTVPQIFIGDRHVGGFDDLTALDRSGKLDPLLAI